jgi:hypothetical protein
MGWWLLMNWWIWQEEMAEVVDFKAGFRKIL